MVYVAYSVLFLLVCSYTVWRISWSCLLAEKKSIYDSFEQYFFDLQMFLISENDLFYRKKKWYEVFFANKQQFLEERMYDISTLSWYQKKFVHDSEFLSEMFPKHSQLPVFSWPSTKNYRKARFRESLNYLSVLFLTIWTLGIWKLLFD